MAHWSNKMNDNDVLESGTKEAILFELRNGTIWTIIDELIHALEHVSFLDKIMWESPVAKYCYRFCNWAQVNRLERNEKNENTIQ